ncbi:tetratricopeptide repeat protein [Fluviicoccus keumensis]|uniref:Tetratricopeptide repeat protein n=1 Tax=Fluviicoccus keumensis TaxID=1435465 RepID=A0A4Q7YP53_9GAMM|nr:tetratricopeptide repeat protein [Fluviicoccus keumensis]RZU38475.1 tetratricopeptide repeat protein [Fluviicoccus keumensis]
MDPVTPPAPPTRRLDRLLGFLSHDPANATLLTDTLQEAIQEGDLAAGSDILSRAARAGVNAAAFQARALHFCLLKTDYESAAAYGDSALAQGLRHSAVVFNTAFARFYLQQYPQCLELLLPYCREQEGHAAANVLAARALHHADREEEALERVLQALEAEPDNAEALGVKALLLYEADDNAEALFCAEHALTLNPDQLDALLAKGEVLLEAERYEMAGQVLAHLVERHPSCGRAWSDLALCAFQDLDLAEVERCGRLAVSLMPDHIGTWHLLAWVYLMRGELPEARQAFQASYALDPDYAETLGGLAAVDALEGHRAKAEQGIRRALALDAACMAAQVAELVLLRQEGNDVEVEALVREMLGRPVDESGESGLDLLARQVRRLSEGKTRH